MQKRIIIDVLIFALGGGVGYLVAKKMLEDQYADLAQEEIDSVKEMYERKIEKLSSSNDNGMTDEEYEKATAKTVLKESVPDEVEKTESIPEQVRRLKKEGYTVTEIADELNMADNIIQGILNQGIKPSPLVRTEPADMGKKVSYHEMAKDRAGSKVVMPKDSIEHRNVFKQAGPRKEIEASDEEDDVGNGPETPERLEHIPDERDLRGIDRTQPYVISSDEYNDEFVEHDKLSIYYYMLDDVLCDENEEVITDIDNTVGWDCFKTLETQTSAWVRNERLAIDYEICLVRSSYAEVILGVPQKVLSPREEYQKRQTRRGNLDE